MIGYLSGTPIVTQHATYLVVQGVGYCVEITTQTKSALMSMERVELYIYSHIKEDRFELYGFATEPEKQLFLKLIAVDGVGPKTALAIMDRGVDGIVTAVRKADVSFFSSVPRVGKKSAQKIIIELKNKLGGEEELDLVEPTGVAREVLEALVALGFSETEGQRVVKIIEVDQMRVEDAVKKAIQMLTASR